MSPSQVLSFYGDRLSLHLNTLSLRESINLRQDLVICPKRFTVVRRNRSTLIKIEFSITGNDGMCLFVMNVLFSVCINVQFIYTFNHMRSSIIGNRVGILLFFLNF